MGISLQQFEAFVWVARLGSFRKTAEKLYTTQPAISARIAKLEDLLGTQLFERASGTTRLSAKGQELLPYVENVLRITQSIVDKSTDPSNFTGILRLGVSETIVHTLLPGFLSSLHEAFPKVDVEILVDVTVNLSRELSEHGIDLAFLMGPITGPNIENFDLASFELVWVISQDHELAKKDSVTAKELGKYPIATYSRNTKPFAEISRYWRENLDGIGRIFPSSSLAASIRMASYGIAVACVPREMASEILPRHDLSIIKSNWNPSNLNFTASYRLEPQNGIAASAARIAQMVSRIS